MRCDDPKCGCQPYPRKNRRVQVVLYGDKPKQFIRLNQKKACVDVHFDPISQAMILREVINEPRWKYTFWYFSVQIDAANMHFVNLEGLPDGSLILSVRLRSSACAVYGNTMKVKEKISGFALPPVRSRLYHDLYHCNWPQMNLQIYLPEEKLVEWKTVALILKSFGRVTVDQWSDMVWNMKNRPSVAGLNWRAIEKEIREDEKKLVDQKVEEKRQSDMLKENNAPILQIQPNILVQQVA